MLLRLELVDDNDGDDIFEDDVANDSFENIDALSQHATVDIVLEDKFRFCFLVDESNEGLVFAELGEMVRRSWLW